MTWRVALRLGRVSNLPTVWTNVVAGAVLAGAALKPVRLVALMAAFSLFYVGGMYLNDAYDRHVDARERPERPIPAGEVSARTVFAAGFALLGLGELVLGVASHAAGRGWLPLAGGLALAATILYYDVRHKTDPLSPVVMGLCRVLVYLTAAAAVTADPSAAVLAGAAVLLGYLVGLTYVAKQENLTEIANLWPLVCLAAPIVYAAPRARESAGAAVLLAVFLAWVVWSLSGLVGARRNIGGAVVRLIAGISLLDAVLIAVHGRVDVALAAAAAVPLTRLLQRVVPGT